MTDYYTYGQRNIASTQAEKVARASETAQSVQNARALYYRPKLIHSGPFVHFTEQQPEPNAWSWIHLGVDAEKNTLLDQCTFFPQHSLGTIDVSLRLIGATFASPRANLDPIEVKSQADISFVVRLKQFVNNSTTPTTIETATQIQTIIFNPATNYPARPVLSLIHSGWISDENQHLWGDPFANTTSRPPQLYEADLPLIQRATISIDFDVADFDPDYPIICEVRADLTGTVSFDGSISTASPVLNPVYVKLFNVGSTMRERGR